MIDATFQHKDGYAFNVRYQSKGSFLRAISKSKNCVLDNAVDYVDCFIIKPKNLEEYKKRKLNK